MDLYDRFANYLFRFLKANICEPFFFEAGDSCGGLTGDGGAFAGLDFSEVSICRCDPKILFSGEDRKGGMPGRQALIGRVGRSPPPTFFLPVLPWSCSQLTPTPPPLPSSFCLLSAGLWNGTSHPQFSHAMVAISPFLRTPCISPLPSIPSFRASPLSSHSL